ncbi:hypothetical protein QFZ74_001677 [Streptomyces sp. V3I7]|nr:hypothetical protein [Streptomyces sp. V3I7]
MNPEGLSRCRDAPAVVHSSLSAPRRMCEHEDGKETHVLEPEPNPRARNESAASLVALVRKQSPYNPGEM